MFNLIDKPACLTPRTGQKVGATRGLFPPCTAVRSLLEAFAEAARNAASGDVVLLSPACPGFDQPRNYQDRGEIFYHAVKSISRGATTGSPNIVRRLVTT